MDEAVGHRDRLPWRRRTLTVHCYVHGSFFFDEQACFIVELHVEAEAIVPLILRLQSLNRQGNVRRLKDQPFAVRHVRDGGVLVERHQRYSDAARAGVGPGSLDLRLFQQEVSLNRQVQGLSFNPMMH